MRIEQSVYLHNGIWEDDDYCYMCSEILGKVFPQTLAAVRITLIVSDEHFDGCVDVELIHQQDVYYNIFIGSTFIGSHNLMTGVTVVVKRENLTKFYFGVEILE